MKRKKLFICIIVLVLILLILNKDYLIKKITMKQIEKDIVSCLNGQFNERISTDTIDSYKKLHMSNKELNHYDVTDLINKYIEIVQDSIEFKKGNEKIVEKYLGYEQINNPSELESGKDILMSYESIMEAISKNLTMQDIKNYDHGIFNMLLIDKLKKCLDYEEQDGKIEWKINSDKNEIINLPFDSYINYKAYNYKLNTDYKKTISVNITNYNDKLNNNYAYVIYETFIGNKETKKIEIYKSNDDKYNVYLPSILGEFNNSLAEANLSNHTYDIMEEEADKAYNEFMAPYIN